MHSDELHDELRDLIAGYTILIKDSWKTPFFDQLFRLVDDTVAAAVRAERERQQKRVREVSSC